MRHRLICFALVCATVPALAQSPKSFKARLAPVPIDLTMQATVAGRGSVTATLAGAKLTVNGAPWCST